MRSLNCHVCPSSCKNRKYYRERERERAFTSRWNASRRTRACFARMISKVNDVPRYHGGSTPARQRWGKRPRMDRSWNLEKGRGSRTWIGEDPRTRVRARRSTNERIVFYRLRNSLDIFYLVSRRGGLGSFCRWSRSYVTHVFRWSLAEERAWADGRWFVSNVERGWSWMQNASGVIVVRLFMYFTVDGLHGWWLESDTEWERKSNGILFTETDVVFLGIGRNFLIESHSFCQILRLPERIDL